MSDRQEFILGRKLTIRHGEGHPCALWVRFRKPVTTAAREPSGDIDTRVELILESEQVHEVDYATGGDDVSALLGALIVAKAHLEALRRRGYSIWWIEPGDFDDDRFWGYQVHY